MAEETLKGHYTKLSLVQVMWTEHAANGALVRKHFVLQVSVRDEEGRGAPDACCRAGHHEGHTIRRATLNYQDGN